MESDVQALTDIFNSVLSAGGPWAMLGALLVGVVRLLRLPLVQSLLQAISPKLAWDSWPGWAKVALPFMLSMAAALIPALIAGGSVTAAIAGAVAAGVSAIALHSGTKAVGSAIDGAAVSKNPSYQPGPVRKAVSPVLPVDASKLKAKLLNPVE